MNKFFLLLSALLLVNTPSFASSWSEDEAWDHCSQSNPCYYAGGSWHSLGEASSDNGWNSYTTTSFTVDIVTAVGISIVVPIIHNVINRTVDYLAYKYDFWGGLRDGGGVAQTKELHEINTSIGGVRNVIEALRLSINQAQLPINEKREALKVISETLEKSSENSAGTIEQLAEFQASIAKNAGETREFFIKALKQISESERQTREILAHSLQENRESNARVARALNQLTEALKSREEKEDE